MRNAFGQPSERQSHLKIPWCTYCDPEIAHIGMQKMEARQRSIPVKSYTAMMQDVDRVITDSQDDGFVKIYVKDGIDEIVGSTIVASRASEMINEMSVIMSSGIGMRQLAAILHSYHSQCSHILRRMQRSTWPSHHRLWLCGSPSAPGLQFTDTHAEPRSVITEVGYNKGIFNMPKAGSYAAKQP